MPQPRNLPRSRSHRSPHLDTHRTGPQGDASLPPGVRAALRGLPELVGRLPTNDSDDAWRAAGIVGVVAELRGLLEAISGHLLLLRPAWPLAAILAVLNREAVRAALLRLVALAVRAGARSGDDGGRNALHSASLSVADSLFPCRGVEFSQRPTALADFVQRLVRMQTLQCLARQFAAAAAAAAALTPGQRRSVELGAQLLCNLTTAYGNTALWTEQEGSSEQLPDAQHEMLAALRDSCVLEHAARLLLLCEGAGTLHAPGQEELPLTVWASGFSTRSLSDSVLATYSNTRMLCCSVPHGAPLREVLRGTCARHAALVHGVALLCRGDGGPTYGLPAAALDAAAPRTMTFPSVPEIRVVAHGAPAFALLAACEEGPPLGRRTAVLLLLRLGRLAVASAGLRPTVEQVTAAPAVLLQGTDVDVVLPMAADPRLGMTNVDTESLAVGSINAAWAHVTAALASAPAPWAAEAGAELWRLVGEATRGGCPSTNCDGFTMLSCDFIQGLRTALPQGEPLPSLPPPLLAVALAGGVLPCLERLLRRAGEDNNGPEAACVADLLLGDDHEPAGFFLICLLKYGEAREAAALVATIGKLLREPAASVDLVAGCAFNAVVGLVYGNDDDAGCTTYHWPDDGQQLSRMASFALCQWLPSLSRAVMRRLAEGGAPGTGCDSLLARLGTLLCWLGLLAIRCTGCGGAAPGSAPGAAPGADGAAASDDWRAFLLEEVAAVPLLGAILDQTQHVCRHHAEDGCPVAINGHTLAMSCCALAVACPDQVRGSAPREPVAAAQAARADGHSTQALSSSAVLVPAPSLPPTPAPPLSAEAPWRPELMRGLGSRLQAFNGAVGANAAEAVAAQLESWAAGGGGGRPSKQGAKCRKRLLAAWEAIAQSNPVLAAIARALPPLAEARAVLRTCSNPACANLAGDSEAELRLQSCSKCAAAAYCCRPCQVAHWHSGHREACALHGQGTGGG